MNSKYMKNKILLTFTISSSIFVVGLLLSISSISGKVFAVVNCNTDNSVTTCSGGTGEHPQPGINGGSGGHSICTDLDCSVSGGGGAGGTQGKPVFHPGTPSGGGNGIHQ
jgi:hypothetical protein